MKEVRTPSGTVTVDFSLEACPEPFKAGTVVIDRHDPFCGTEWVVVGIGIVPGTAHKQEAVWFMESGSDENGICRYHTDPARSYVQRPDNPLAWILIIRNWLFAFLSG